MTTEPTPEQTAAARLLALLTRTDTLDHAAAEAAIPELVEAELSGTDVDNDPRFVAVLQHLEGCTRCLAIYERTAEALAEFPIIPALSATPSVSPFVLLRSTAYAALRSLRGAIRRFELSLTLPALQPVAIGGTALTLFDATLDELPGAPELAVTLVRTASTPRLRVALREAAAAPWEARLQLDDAQYAAQPGPDGVAEVEGFTEAQLQSARILDLWIVPAADE